MDRLLIGRWGGMTGTRRGQIIKTHLNTCGYVRVTLHSERKSKRFLLHRLVLKTFNGEIPKDLETDHLKGRKLDNRLFMLEAVTSSENTRRAFALGLQKGGRGFNKPVYQYTLQGEFVDLFESCKQASAHIGLSKTSVSACARGVSSTAGGYKWTFKPFKS
jgi:hypothetical protein